MATRSASWVPLRKQKSEPKKGTLYAFGGFVLDHGITLAEARAKYQGLYTIRTAGRKSSDALDKRLPGSYGSRR